MYFYRLIEKKYLKFKENNKLATISSNKLNFEKITSIIYRHKSTPFVSIMNYVRIFWRNATYVRKQKIYFFLNLREYSQTHTHTHSHTHNHTHAITHTQSDIFLAHKQTLSHSDTYRDTYSHTHVHTHSQTRRHRHTHRRTSRPCLDDKK